MLGESAYGTVQQIPGQVDVMDVFLPPQKTPEIAEDAVQAEAKVLWLQEGIENEEARRIAKKEGSPTSRTGACAKLTRGYKKVRSTLLRVYTSYSTTFVTNCKRDLGDQAASTKSCPKKRRQRCPSYIRQSGAPSLIGYARN